MENNLMDSEVLCIFDTRHIQRYIFRTDSMTEAIGGSDLINHILQDAIRYSLSHIVPSIGADECDFSDDPYGEIPYFKNKRIKVQQIVCTAGNAMLIFRSGALAQKVISRLMSHALHSAHALV